MQIVKLFLSFSIFTILALALRSGILLSRISKFNLPHDSPRHEVNESSL